MFDQLKSLIQNGERYIVVEDGKPEYVVMSFADYVQSMSAKKMPQTASSSNPRPVWERVNSELAVEPSPIMEPAPGITFGPQPSNPMPDPATVRLEDLPL